MNAFYHVKSSGLRAFGHLRGKGGGGERGTDRKRDSETETKRQKDKQTGRWWLPCSMGTQVSSHVWWTCMWDSALCSRERWLEYRCSGQNSYRKCSKFTHHTAFPTGHDQSVVSGVSECNEHTLTEVKDKSKGQSNSLAEEASKYCCHYYAAGK